MENNIPERARAVVNTPVQDPSLAAILVALDFPLIRPRFAVKKIDLSSGHREATAADVDSWVFGDTSPTNGKISDAISLFQTPLPRTPEDLSTIQRAKLCLHNRRVLKLAAVQRLPLHQASNAKFSRLSSWAFSNSAPVPENYETVLPRVTNTDLVSIATAFGHKIDSSARYGDQLSFLLLNNPAAIYSVAEIENKFRDRAYIRANVDPLAVCAAACLSFKALFDASRLGGETLVLHKNGRYATLPKNATEEEKIAVARHLST
jgi:hypothetical protein